MEKNDLLLYNSSSQEVKKKFNELINCEFYKDLISGKLSLDDYLNFLEMDITYLSHKENLAVKYCEKMNNLSIGEGDVFLNLSRKVNDSKQIFIEMYKDITNEEPKYIHGIGLEPLSKIANNNSSCLLSIFYMSTACFYFIFKQNCDLYSKKSPRVASLFMSKDWSFVAEKVIFKLNEIFLSNKIVAIEIFEIVCDFELFFVKKVKKYEDR